MIIDNVGTVWHGKRKTEKSEYLAYYINLKNMYLRIYGNVPPG